MAKKGRKILIVDDDSHILSLLSEQLSAPGRSVRKAGSGMEAIRAGLADPPDLIILDVMMPGLNGYQVCRFFRNVPTLKHCAVLFLTVQQGVGDRQRGLLLGADDYLTKPFDMDSLEEKVAGLLSGRGAVPAAGEPSGEAPPAESVDDEYVFALMDRVLNESVLRFSLLEKVSQRLLSAAGSEEILRTVLASVVSPVGLGWDRCLLMTPNDDGSALEGRMAFALSEEADDGRHRWRHLQSSVRSRTMEELFEDGLKPFTFQSAADDRWVGDLSLRMSKGGLTSPAGRGDAGEILRAALPESAAQRFFRSVFWSQDVTAVPVAGKEKLFGVVAADRHFSHGAAVPGDAEHLWFLCRQAGLALERQELFQREQERAREFEDLTLLHESIVAGVDLGIVFLDTGGRVAMWNPSMERFSGVKRKKAEGEKFFALFPDLEGTFVEQRYRKSVESRSTARVGHFEYAFGGRKKGIYDIRFSAIREGRKVLGTALVFEDVKLRITLEEKVRQAYRYLDNLITHSGDAILTVDGAGKIRSWNQGAEEIFGYTRGEIVGKAFSRLFPQDRKKEARAILDRTRDDGKVLNHIVTLAGGRDRHVEGSITTSIIDREEGVKADVAAIIRDVSERRRLEAQLFQTEKLASLGTMAAGMAHEINNPLTSIMMYAQLLSMSGAFGEEDRTCIERIEEDAGRIADIVNSLLVFSRPSSRRVEDVDLKEMIEKAVSFIRYQGGRKNIEVEKSHDGAIPALQGVATEIQEIFLNLLINARDAMDGEGTIRVTSRCYPPQPKKSLPFPGAWPRGVAEVKIADEGTGIPGKEQGRIFDPFYTTKPPGKGTGLGLAVVRRLVENHGGTIFVKSRVGEGTTFTVLLPLP